MVAKKDEPLNTPAAPGIAGRSSGFAFKSLPSSAEATVAPTTNAVALSFDTFSGVATNAKPAELALAEKERPPQAGASIQYFSRSEAKAESDRLATRDDKTVLGSFRTERSGSKLLVVDSDGSVYSGTLNALRQPAGSPSAFGGSLESSKSALGAPSNRARSSRDAAKEPVAGYFFRVTGTNRTSGQLIVFSGTFPAQNGAARFWRLQPSSGTTNVVQSLKAQAAAAPVLEAPLTGKIIIGSRKPVEIQAVQVQAPPSK